MVEVIKSLKQAYYKGLPSKYELPKGAERGFILSYAENNEDAAGGKQVLRSFIDSANQVTRVSFQMKMRVAMKPSA